MLHSSRRPTPPEWGRPTVRAISIVFRISVSAAGIWPRDAAAQAIAVVPAPLELVSPAIPDGECFLEERFGETVVTLGQVGVADALQRVGQAPLILGGASQLRGLYEVLPCPDWVGRGRPVP